MADERIRIFIEAINKNASDIANKISQDFKKLTKDVKDFRKTMGLPLKQFQDLNKQGRVFKTTGGKLANNFRLMTHGLRGFRLEMLGVLFFGQSMVQLFSGMLNPAANLFGMFELIGTTLEIVFLPIIEALFPVFLKLITFFMDLPEPVKLIIGGIALFGLVLGGLLSVLGNVFLGLGSLILFFSQTVQAGNAIGGVIGGVTSGLLLLFGVSKGAEAFANFFKDKLEPAIESFIDKVLQLDVVKEALKKLGIEATSNESVWEQFKKKITDIIDNIKSKIGEFLEQIGFAKTDIEDLGTKFNDFVDDVNELKNALITFVTKVTPVLDFINGLLDKLASVDKFLKGIGNDPERVAILERDKARVRNRHKRTEDDFIMRPGQAPVSINPNDTLVGFKRGGGPSGLGGGATVNTVNNINVIDKRALARILDDRDKKLVDELRRMVGSNF
jgi:gas vesicle protein